MRLGAAFFLLLLAALVPGVHDARAARTLLADLLARLPAADASPALNLDKLESCLRTARELDKSGVALDEQISEIERIAAEGMLLQYQMKMQMPGVDDADKAALDDLQRRAARHKELAQEFKDKYPSFEKRKADYDSAVAAFGHDCAGSFTARDLEAAKNKLQIK